MRELKILAKLDVLHAALIETARRSHPYEGHTLSLNRWNDVLDDTEFQESCNQKFDSGRKKLFGGSSNPSPADYQALRDAYGQYLERWQAWPAVRAFFFSLDAEEQLKQTDTEAFLSEILEDVVHEELVDQVERGYLKL